MKGHSKFQREPCCKKHHGFRYVIVGFCVIFFIGIIGLNLNAQSKERYLTLQLFAKVLNLVQEHYVEDVDIKKLIHGGIKGMLNELDPHTHILGPELFKEFQTETSGQFGGLGVEVTLIKDVLTIISPIEDTPAWRAGLKPGDKIVSINGESTKGLSLAEAAQRMRDPKGKIIHLGIFREGLIKPKMYSIERGIVKIHSSKYTNLKEGYAYVKITSFIESTSKDFKNILKKHIKDNKKIKGLIIDIRRNPGGLLDQAIAVSDLFLSKGVIVSTRGKKKNQEHTWYASKHGTYKGFPIIILIDEYSASASEILAGALQDNKRALIMGQKSFGKGSVQSMVRLNDGSALKITVARYYTPKGSSIQAEGIIPDIKVAHIDAAILQQATSQVLFTKRERDIVGHLQNEKSSNKNKEGSDKGGKVTGKSFWWNQSHDKKDLSPKGQLLRDDFQVLQAYNYLKAWKVMSGFGYNEKRNEQHNEKGKDQKL